MTMSNRSRTRFGPSLSWVLLCIFFAVLAVAGGASRGDAIGQALVRGVSAASLIIFALFGDRPTLMHARPVAMLLAGAILLPLLQLLPLPPALWQALPGRSIFAEAVPASRAQPWRTWTIVPGATVNSISSLIVPVTTLVLVAGLRTRERSWLPGLMLSMVIAATLVGLLQVSGAGIDNPLINDTLGVVSGTFANRNHFALFLALGCLLVPAWMFLNGRRPGWRGPVGIGLVLLFALMILATGSRAGIALGVLAIGMGLALARPGIRRELSHYPAWVASALIAALIGMIAVFVLISIAADRAASIDRVLALDMGSDMRSRGFPTVLSMIWVYFPFGAGFGTFDPVFRMHEPFYLLKLTFFNHAHNDLAEVMLEGGLAGMLLLAASLLWWAMASLRVWRSMPSHAGLAKLGSTMLLLIIIASGFDYPSRVPIIMATIMISAIWLAVSGAGGLDRPLPPKGEPL